MAGGAGPGFAFGQRPHRAAPRGMRRMVSLLTAPILITGGSGQLGHALADAARARGLEHVVASRPEFDFDIGGTIEFCVASAQPWLVINAAAYTAVDLAEK